MTMPVAADASGLPTLLQRFCRSGESRDRASLERTTTQASSGLPALLHEAPVASGLPTLLQRICRSGESRDRASLERTTTQASSGLPALLHEAPVASGLPTHLQRNRRSGGSCEQVKRQHGFMLLEAIVALVIFSLVAVSLYAWQNTNIQAIQRAEAHARSNAATRSALAVIADVNPILTPRGERPLGPDTVRWTATPVRPKRDGVTAVGLPNLFELGLYDMHVQVLEGDRVVASFQVRQAGYKQVRVLESP